MRKKGENNIYHRKVAENAKYWLSCPPVPFKITGKYLPVLGLNKTTELLKFVYQKAYCHDPFLLTSGPLLPVWCLLPRPGVNVFYLDIIERLYRSKYLSVGIFESWMALNAGRYQLGVNPSLLSLWKERIEFIQTIDSVTIQQLLDKGAGVRSRNRDNQIRLNYDELLLKDCVHVRYFKIFKCRSHKILHVSVRQGVAARAKLKLLNVLFPWTEYEDKQKTNLDLASLATQAIMKGYLTQVNKVLEMYPIGTLNTLVTTTLISALGNSEFERMYVLVMNDKACCMPLYNYGKYYKAISTAVRRTSHWYDGEELGLAQVSMLAYYEMGTGRAAHRTDWDEEYNKRIGPKLPLIDPFSKEDFLIRARKVAEELVPKMFPPHDKWGSWDDFVCQRQSWAQSGSSGGYSVQINGKRVKLNKKSALECIKSETMSKWIYEEEAVLKAVGSDKLELGKDRAIYATNLVDQTITTYVLLPLEKRLSKIDGVISGRTGREEVADIGHRLLKLSQSDECMMVDYKDFNYQHTLEAQWMLFDVVLNEVKKYNNADLTTACTWLRDAQLNQQVNFPNRMGYHQVTQGMYSGCRATNFINTLMNVIYYTTAKEIVKDNTGLVPDNEIHFHQGDDVWISNRSRIWGVTMYDVMIKAGFEFQDSKQLFDRSKAELLRVLYGPDGARGYVMRGAASLVVKPIQNALEVAPQNKATGLTSAIHLLYRRGLSSEGCNVVWWACVPHALRMKLPDGAGVGIPVHIATKRFVDGGLDLGPPGTFAVASTKAPTLPAPRIQSNDLEKAVGMEMTNDWVVHMSKQIKDTFNADKIREKLHAANVCDSLRPKDRVLMLRQLEKDLKIWKDKVASVDWGSISNTRVISDIAGYERESSVLDVLLMRNMKVLNMVVEAGSCAVRDMRMVETIISGISASPFRDLATAKSALGLSTIEAARAALALSDTASARLGLTLLRQIEDRLGSDVLTVILKGIRGAGLSYESQLHPITLSHLCKTATNRAIMSAMQKGIRTQYEWFAELEYWMENVLRYSAHETKLREWSHY